MANVANDNDKSNDAAAAAVVEYALITLDCRAKAEAISRAPPGGRWSFAVGMSMDEAVASIATLDAAVAMMAADALRDEPPEGAAEIASAFAGCACRFTAQVYRLSGRPVPADLPGDAITEDDHAGVGAAARLMRAENFRREAAHAAGHPVPPDAGANRPAQWAWFMAVADAVAAITSPRLKAIMVLLQVASVAGVKEYDIDPDGGPATHAPVEMLKALDPADDGVALVRRALSILGHKPSEFTASGSGDERRERRAAALARLRDRDPAAFRLKVRDACVAAGGVNYRAANLIKVSTEDLRKLIAGDAELAAEYGAADLATRH